MSGGGTGGHIFPALSIANEIRERYPYSEILFVGALGRMEMEKVPAAGYKIIGLPVVGFPKKTWIENGKIRNQPFKEYADGKKNHKGFSAGYCHWGLEVMPVVQY